MEKINILVDIIEENEELSDELRRKYTENGLTVIGILGAPGSGKTTLLENILPGLAQKKRTAVIEGDIATDNDAERIRSLGVGSVQIMTNGACHLDSDMIEDAISRIVLNDYDLMIIENVGNLVCPIDFPLGEDKRIAVISTAEGEDKPLKYPAASLQTDAVVITKTDIAKYVRADAKKMAKYVHDINPKSRVFFAGYDEKGDYSCVSEDGGMTLSDYILE